MDAMGAEEEGELLGSTLCSCFTYPVPCLWA